MSWLARDGGDHGTLWAATSAGRIFVTHNADATDPSAVTWHRIDSSTSGNSPTRFPSGIYVDPANSGHAWISYSGYNQATKDSPGHVFEVTVVGAAAQWRDLNVEQGEITAELPRADLPVTDLVRDDFTGDLYASTDFGVLRGTQAAGGTYAWPPWEEPEWHERLKPVYAALRDAWGSW